MIRDFTLAIYRQLLDQLQAAGFSFQTFAEFLRAPVSKTILLRHDIDARKSHALTFAKIQQERGIKGTYYFRLVPQSFDENIIREIHGMGHEVGYHYEDMDFAGGDPHRAIRFFEDHLQQLRNVVPVETICMHGSPQSRYDNRDVWQHYDYRDYGIIGEPYFDIDFRRVFYLTDTGRCWDGHKFSVRDKVEDHFGLSFHSTPELIAAAEQGSLPNQVMINFHPQRWTDNRLLWTSEKYIQQVKNMAKYLLIRYRKNNTPKTVSKAE